MNLKNFFSQFKEKPQEEQKFFLAIEISSQDVKSALWTVAAAKTEVVKVGSAEKWNGKEKESLLTAVDNSISTACEKAKSEPQGIIFGLPLNWIQAEDIEADKKEFLKFICQKLELKPLGFVASLEALVTFLKQNEGTPINAVFIQFLEEQLLISLVELGKIKSSEIVGRSDDLVADVQEGLSRFKKAQNLPARIIIYNGTQGLEDEKQKIVAFDWQDKLPFLHFPRVESLEKNKTIRAVALSGGAEVAKSLGFEIQAKEEEKTSEAEDKSETKEEIIESTPAENEKKETLTNEQGIEKSLLSAADLGFVTGEDIAQKTTEPEPEIKEKADEIKTEVKEKVETEVKEASPTEPEPVITASSSPQNLFTKISQGLKRIFFKLKLLILGGKKKIKIFFLILPLLLLVLGAWAFFWYIPKAKITLYLTPKTVEKEISLTADLSTDAVDLENKIIPAVTQTITVNDKKSKAASGEKTIGDKAAGQVTIYNKTDVSKTFNAGEVLVGPDKLEFILQEEVSIASRSSEPSEEGEQIIYGKSQAEVKAGQIGTESNLSSGANLNFKNYAEGQFSAKTEEGLSGGTSQQVKVVSQNDLDDLENSLSEQLKEEALEKLADQLGDENVILDQGLEKEVLKQSFSAEANDEADQVELSLEIKFTAFAWDKADLKTILMTLVQDEMEDFILDAGKTDLDIQETELDDNQINIEALAKIYLLPKIDFSQLKTDLKGCQINQCQNQFKKLPHFNEAEIEITPNFAGLFKRLPRNKQNIIIDTKQEE